MDHSGTTPQPPQGLSLSHIAELRKLEEALGRGCEILQSSPELWKQTADANYSLLNAHHACQVAHRRLALVLDNYPVEPEELFDVRSIRELLRLSRQKTVASESTEPLRNGNETR